MFNQLWHDLWITVFVILIFIGIFAGQGLVIGFGVMGLLVAGVAWFWNRVSLEDLSYERQLSQQRVFIGEEFTIQITLTNKKPLPLGKVSVEDDFPESIEVADADMVLSPYPETNTMRHATSMAWYDRVRWEYTAKCSRRGYFRLGPVRIESGDLFGFFNSEATLRDRGYVLVYPKVYSLEELGIPSARPLGDTKGGIRIFEDYSRPMGIRDYQRGDPLKIVDWKATARMDSLQVRTYEPSSSITVTLVVAVDTAARYWEGYSSINLERVITAAASFASYAHERQYSLGLFSNGTPILADRPMRIPPNRLPEQLTIILEALATLRPLAMGPMVTLLAENSRRFPLGSTIVIVTAFLPEEFAEVIRSLKTHGYQVVVVYVGDGDCPQLAEGVIVHELTEYFDRMELASEFGPR